MNIWITRSRSVEFFAFGVVLALLMVAIGLWIGISFWPAPAAELPGVQDLDSATAARGSENAALAARIAALKAGLAGDICKLNPKLTAPLGEVDPQDPVPPASVPPQAGNSQFKGTLVQLVDQATVMVLSQNASGLEMGSGFFISPSTIVTNNHVIDGALPGKIIVINQAIGKPVEATVIAATHSSVIGTPDFALLSVAAQPAIQPLAVTSSVEQLEAVVAAGYPGIDVTNDQKFTDLMDGSGTAAPSVILTEGRISAIETSSAGTGMLPHTADIAPGNSGGPLVDQCGRVVGVDTFVSAGANDTGHGNYALEAQPLADFLKAGGNPVDLLTTTCNAPDAPQGPVPAASPP